MSEINELEQALVMVAADADSRNYEDQKLYENDEGQEEEAISKDSYIYTKISDDVDTNNYPSQVINNLKESKKRQNEDLENVTRSERESKTLKRKYENSEDGVTKSQRVHSNVANEDIHQKFKRDDSEDDITTSQRGYANVVATHYNKLEEKGLDERFKSRIVHLRNFHNWIKSMLINEYLTKIKDGKRHNAPVRVHDMCCGKGGDLLKWKKGGISHLICSDIAEVSLDQCKARYTDMKNRSARDRGPNLYSIEYIAGDCSRLRLREKYSDPSMSLDLVSCQFAFHYSFESLSQAECMFRNAAECLQPGGYFIGTIPDAYEIVTRAKKCNNKSFGNKVYEVSIDFDINKPPLFGAKYNFQLDGVVNCPEFLVYFPILVKLAKKFGLKLVRTEKFYDFFERMKEEGKYLLTNMRSLEAYPAPDSVQLVGTDASDYIHAETFITKEQRGSLKIGTLSKSEWEVSSLYTTFVFEKVKNTWNADGTPLYDI
ncbi:mRNA cap guanine-N(7) methyltransferase [Diabrotica undecimpunctata]|uniref:mRNA cap guanine-N(7) methyltransferase n=1 Tax=Diabrotica undecimpunctata TaxID=50387 RepID=UPI003B6419E5